MDTGVPSGFLAVSSFIDIVWLAVDFFEFITSVLLLAGTMTDKGVFIHFLSSFCLASGYLFLLFLFSSLHSSICDASSACLQRGHSYNPLLSRSMTVPLPVGLSISVPPMDYPLSYL